MSGELKTLIKSYQFQDIDEPADRMGRFCWNMVHRQIEGGPFQGELLIAQLGGLQFSRVMFNRGIRSWGNSPKGTIAIAVPLSEPQLINWHGQPLSNHHVILQKSSNGIDYLRRGKFQQAIVTVDVALLMKSAELMNQPQIEQLVLDETITVQPDGTTLNRFKRYFQNLFAMLQQKPEHALKPAMQRFVCKRALPLILDMLSPIPEVAPLHASSRCKLMRQAEAILLENLDQPLTVQDLCAALHVSERTLRYGFQECFGTSPIAYLKAHRLNGVRRQLKASSGDRKTVTDIAIQWGFWHMGQFARDFREMFGECPSKTLRQSS